MDMVSTDEMGRLPDKNIGETLNRIPGVSMLLEKGEGRFIQIRGISPRLNNVTINGLAIGNAETESGGRLLPLDVIGGELLSNVQVFKTPTPDMDGQGIGGTLNLTTKQPFDFANKFTTLVSTRVGAKASTRSARPTPRKCPTRWTSRWPGRRRTRSSAGSRARRSRTATRRCLASTTTTGGRSRRAGEHTYPTNVKNNVTVTGRERLNVNAALEARPNATSNFFVRSFFANWDEIQLRNRYDEGLGDAADDYRQPQRRGGERSRAGQSEERGHRQAAAVGHLRRHQHLQPLDARLRGAAHANLVDEPNDNWEFRSGANTFGPDSFVIDEHGAITITSPGRDRKDPALQGFRRVRYFKQRTDEDAWIGSAFLRRDMVVDGNKPAFLKFGAKFSETEAADRSVAAVLQHRHAQLEPVAGARGHLGGFDNPVPMLTVPNLWLDLNGLNAFFNANQNDPRYFAPDQATTYMSEYQSDFSSRSGSARRSRWAASTSARRASSAAFAPRPPTSTRLPSPSSTRAGGCRRSRSRDPAPTRRGCRRSSPASICAAT